MRDDKPAAKTRSSRRFYVYIWYDPRSGKPFWVGKGQGLRAYDLSPSSRRDSLLLCNVLNKIYKSGLKPEVKIISRFSNEQRAYKFETKLITEIGRRDLKTGSLCNMTAGGDGVSGSTRLADKSRETMLRLHANPMFREKLQNTARKTMMRLQADPEFRRRSAERGADYLRQRHASDPEFTRVAAERGRKALQLVNANRRRIIDDER